MKEQEIVDEAIAWHLRLAAASDQDWLRFTDWLEADRTHAAAYDRILDDEILAAPTLDLESEGRGSVRKAARLDAVWRRRGGWMLAAGSALAASIAAIVFLPSTQPGTDGLSIVTAPGEKRDVILADGSRVEVNGGTELLVEGPRRVSLKRGQAVFHVRHDERDPFQVSTGGVVLRDVGTVFDVASEGGKLGVQVAEGAVMYQPNREGLTLRQGMSLSTRAGDDRIVVRRIAPESVGGWRVGRLTFREAPLREVAAAIRRTTGQDLAVAASLTNVAFTGSIRLAGDSARDAAHLADLAGGTARRKGSGWILTSVGDAPD